MNLTIDARLISSSGIGVYLQNIIKSDLLLQYDLVFLYKEADKSYFNQVKTHANLVRYDAELYSVKELLDSPAKTRKTDIFWSPHYNVPLFNFAKKLKVVTIHDVFHLAYYHTLSLKQKLYAKTMINRAISNTDIIFTVSNFSKREIIKYTGCNADKIKVVYNGIDYDKFSCSFTALQKASVLTKYGLKLPYILFVGNVKPHKNLKNALLGFKKFIERGGVKFQEFEFVIAGKREGFIIGDLEIEGLLSDSFFKNKVRFTGWVTDEELPVLYQSAATFIFPSIYEGFGFPPLEAMAAGCPVVSSNAACLAEVYGDAVLYFDPLNPLEIANALLKVQEEEARAGLIKKGLTQSAKYKWSNAVSQKLNFISGYL